MAFLYILNSFFCFVLFLLIFFALHAAGRGDGAGVSSGACYHSGARRSRFSRRFELVIFFLQLFVY